MKKIVFCCAMMTTLFLIAFSVVGQEQAETPTYKDGDSWQFKVVEKGMAVQTTAVLDRNYQVSFSGGEVTVRPAFRELGRMLGIEEERRYLQFPLVVGKTWHTRYRLEGPDYMRSTTSVTGVEDVTTSAGTFRALKIDRYDTRFGGQGDRGRGESRVSGKWIYTYYYSPQTRSVVKYSLYIRGGGTREIELIKFRTAR
jgi:hypothetical protein